MQQLQADNSIASPYLSCPLQTLYKTPQQSTSSSTHCPLDPTALKPGCSNSDTPIDSSNHKGLIIDSLKQNWSKGQTFHWFMDNIQHAEDIQPDLTSIYSQRGYCPSETLELFNCPSASNHIASQPSDGFKSNSVYGSPFSKHSETISIKDRRWSDDPGSKGILLSEPAFSTITTGAQELSDWTLPKHNNIASMFTAHSQSAFNSYHKANSKPSSIDPLNAASDYETWDDFLKAYSQGQFPDDTYVRPQRLGPDLPPFHPYARASTQSPPPFLAAPLPPNEEKRIQALYSFQILETGSDVNFDRIAQLVATVLSVSGCMICLVDQDNVSIKANYRASNMECRREVSLSGHAILRAPDDPLVVLDATKDWRFKGLPAVKGGPLVRFYAGAALMSPDGNNIGSLCVIDPEPRADFSEKEKQLLIDFAAVVMREMTLWNDQVNLCTRTRMMRDITCWVRSCINMTESESTATPAYNSGPRMEVETQADIPQPHFIPPLDGNRAIPTVSGPSYKQQNFHRSTQDSTNLPTPDGSPIFSVKEMDSCDAKSTLNSTIGHSQNEIVSTGDLLRDKAFRSACNMIQVTLGVDAVYLIQAGPNKSYISQSESGVTWNLWSSKTRSKGAVGTAGGVKPFEGHPDLMLVCLASNSRQSIDDPIRNARRQGESWVCAEGGCRPHRIRDFTQRRVGPDWERDVPVITEALCYVRRLKSAPTQQSGESSMYTCCSESEDNEWFEPAQTPSCRQADSSSCPGSLCHIFQGTLQQFEAGSNTPYRSCMVLPIRGASPRESTRGGIDDPWAYFVVLTSSPTKQFLPHEQIYLKNFGSCLATEVTKQRIQAADKAKGTFIKNISHELRTPLHIILGILELLKANTEETLTEQQLMMLGSAEASGKGLIDMINNIIDLADLDSNSRTNIEQSRKQLSDLFASVTEIDIRVLSEEIATFMAKQYSDKNLVINHSWLAPSQSPLRSPSLGCVSEFKSKSTDPDGSITVNATIDSTTSDALPSTKRDISQSELHARLAASNLRLDDPKSSLEIIVAIDETEKVSGKDIHWNFMLNLPIIRRILIQLLENAIKFTTTGYVEISAVSPPLSKFPLKPPQPGMLPVLFTVRDTGKGISPEYIQAHLFERFSQENPLQPGTGLGLALVKLLVESLGGWLEVWSEGIEGKGCVVRVLLWAYPSKNEDVESLRDGNEPWKGKSCRFYTGGDSNEGRDRLWEILGERMMTHGLGVDVERDDGDTIQPEAIESMKNGSPYDLLVLNDNFRQLKAYLDYWSDQCLRMPGSHDQKAIPLLMLTTISREKKARAMVEAYLKSSRESFDDSNFHNHPIRVVIISKPIGLHKLMKCLHDCFSDDVRDGINNHTVDTPTVNDVADANVHTRLSVTTTLCEQSIQKTHTGPFKLTRSASSPYITALSIDSGVMNGEIREKENEVFSPTGSLMESFKFPVTSLAPGPGTIGGNVGIGVGYFDIAYSPGGLVLPGGTKKKDNNDVKTIVSRYTQKLDLEDKMSPKSNNHKTEGDLLLLGETLKTPQLQPTSTQHHPSRPTPQQEQREQHSDRRKPRKSIRNFHSHHRHGLSRSESRKSDTEAFGSACHPTKGNTESSLSIIENSTTASPIVTPSSVGSSQPLTPPISINDSFSWSNLRVLIVEDNATNRMILRTFLKKKGATVVEAENGQIGVNRFKEALESSSSHGSRTKRAGFDFVLMDLQMPVMDGHQATKHIREAEQKIIQHEGLSAQAAEMATAFDTTDAVITAAGGFASWLNQETFGNLMVAQDNDSHGEGGYFPTMIFALTGLAGEEDKRMAFECGVDGYLTKPVSLHQLASLFFTCYRPLLPRP
ncbi:His Kinase A domain containing protein [Linnemannia zychae]|nr:His Kinase A domain containing protein [Linnemannia zychae]